MVPKLNCKNNKNISISKKKLGCFKQMRIVWVWRHYSVGKMLTVQPGGLELGYLECMYKPGMTKHTVMLPMKGMGRWSPMMCWAVSSAETVHGSVKDPATKSKMENNKERHQTFTSGLFLSSTHTHTHTFIVHNLNKTLLENNSFQML